MSFVIPVPEDAVPTTVDFAVMGARKWQQTGGQPKAMWVTVYRMAMARREHFPARLLLVDLAEVVALLHWGRVKYLDGSEAQFELTSDYNLHLDGASIRERESIEGAWLALVTPLEWEGAPRIEQLARQRVETAVALLSALHNDNIAFSLLAENEYAFDGGKLGCYSPVFRSPLALPAPDLELPRLKATQSAAAALNSGPAQHHNRITLALRWYRQALEADGVDAILKTWIAIEVLAMSSSNISPVCAKLGRIYGISAHDAKMHFMIGKYFGLRSRIIHDGAAPTIDSVLTGLLQRVFVDLLRLELHAATMAEALRFLQFHAQDLSASMTQALAE